MRELCIKFRCFLDEERGSFGIKEIAVTVAVIVLIGAIVAALKSSMGGYITQIWDLFIAEIKKMTS